MSSPVITAAISESAAVDHRARCSTPSSTQTAPLDVQRDAGIAPSRSSLLAGNGLTQDVSPQRESQAVDLHFKICASYIGYIARTTGDNASTTQEKGHAGYVKDTQFGTVDKCR